MAITRSLSTAISDGASSGMFKNRIINGDMRIDQRNGGASQSITSGSVVYTLDRWLVYSAGGTTTSQRVGSVGSYSLQLTGSSGVSAIQVLHRIESVNIADLSGQSVTLSFTLSSSSLSTVSFYAQTPTATDNYAGTNSPILIGSPTITSTPTKFSYTFTLPASATNGCQIFIQTGAFTSGTLTYTNVQLEAGTTATNFERRAYGHELALCQRYYERVTGSQYTKIGIGYGVAGGYVAVCFPLKTTKRANITFTVGGVTDFRNNDNANNRQTTNIIINAYGATTDIVEIDFYSANLTSGNMYIVDIGNASGSWLGFSAEL